jgi:hypothetical protein
MRCQMYIYGFSLGMVMANILVGLGMQPKFVGLRSLHDHYSGSYNDPLGLYSAITHVIQRSVRNVDWFCFSTIMVSLDKVTYMLKELTEVCQ